MQTKNLLAKTITLALLAFTTTVGFGQKPKKTISNPILVNTTWSCDTTYFLKGIIYVKNNAVLTINPGTVITGDTTNKGSLVITRGAKINATGTATCPIVFTSSRKPGLRRRGDWGGVILLGKAPINQPGGEANIEGITPTDDTKYGGGANPLPNDNSGTLKYVRVEFAGVALSPNNEINGLTLGGVGSGTTLEYIQVSFSNDDSFEWFGGTVNAKHIIAFRGIDDDFDTDNGYSGKVQFAMGLRDPKVADISGSKAFESDNDASGSTNLPQTKAVFCNVTATAGKDTTANSLYTAAAHIRRNSHEYIYNSILMGFPAGLLIDGTLTQNSVLSDTLVVDNFITCKDPSKYVVTAPTGGVSNVINLLLSSNTYYVGNKKVKLTLPYNLDAPNYRPKATSPALNAADFNHAPLNDPFFTKVSYVGAFDQTNDWTAGWANFDPIHADYNNTCCTPKAQIAADNAIVANELSASDNDLTVFPNPTRGSFKLNITGFKSNVNVKITNMNGATIYNAKQPVSAKSLQTDVDLKNAPAGTYFVEVTDGSKLVTKKINIVK